EKINLDTSDLEAQSLESLFAITVASYAAHQRRLVFSRRQSHVARGAPQHRTAWLYGQFNAAYNPRISSFRSAAGSHYGEGEKAKAASIPAIRSFVRSQRSRVA